jgi:hypothetical protein
MNVVFIGRAKGAQEYSLGQRPGKANYRNRPALKARNRPPALPQQYGGLKSLYVVPIPVCSIFPYFQSLSRDANDLRRLNIHQNSGIERVDPVIEPFLCPREGYSPVIARHV